MTRGLFTLQHDDAPAHRARETVQLLSERTDARIMGPKIWPPNSVNNSAAYALRMFGTFFCATRYINNNNNNLYKKVKGKGAYS